MFPSYQSAWSGCYLCARDALSFRRVHHSKAWNYQYAPFCRRTHRCSYLLERRRRVLSTRVLANRLGSLHLKKRNSSNVTVLYPSLKMNTCSASSDWSMNSCREQSRNSIILEALSSRKSANCEYKLLAYAFDGWQSVKKEPMQYKRQKLAARLGLSPPKSQQHN